MPEASLSNLIDQLGCLVSLMHASKGVVEEAYWRASIKLLAKDDHFCEGYALSKATNKLGKEAFE